MRNLNRPLEHVPLDELRDMERDALRKLGLADDVIDDIQAPREYRELRARPTSPANIRWWTRECLRQGISRDRLARVLADHQGLTPEQVAQVLSAVEVTPPAG